VNCAALSREVTQTTLAMSRVIGCSLHVSHFWVYTLQCSSQT